MRIPTFVGNIKIKLKEMEIEVSRPSYERLKMKGEEVDIEVR